MTKPIKSACFNLEVRKAPLTSSLKERIKLNKQLTLSPKTGQLIGVMKKKATEDYVTIPMMDLPFSHRNLIQHRDNRLYQLQGKRIMSFDRSK